MLILANLLALALVAADQPQASTGPVSCQDPEVWNLTLPEAIRIGLENAETVRVISLGDQGVSLGGFEAPSKGEPNATPIVIARLNADESAWQFKAALMAHVRSVEQTYWALAQQQVVVWSRKTAVKLAEEILARERADLTTGRSNTSDIAETEQQLENLKLNLVTATSDRITTERQLRNILGLPAADNRRIIPASSPTEAKVQPEWEASLATMLASDPAIALQREQVAAAELAALIDGENPTIAPERREESRRNLDRQQALLPRTIQDSTHTLSRFFLEVDSNYRQFQTARKLQAAARQRLESQRAFYNEGRIAVDRLLDAINQYANAISQEAQFLASYNTSIAALEEAKGTLLTHDGINLAEGPSSEKVYAQAKDDRVAPAAFETPTPAPAPVAPAPPTPQAGPTTYKLRAKLGGIKVWEIELEINQGPAPSR
ncbi:TolC family protein [Tundrisphaera lichenicola]|uniref:TolC family protein n=1 Tax=Tundrisphaera lichenicola TaxID=2029860 RepID=UPI003EB7E1FF